jgi:hypothetical protein
VDESIKHVKMGFDAYKQANEQAIVDDDEDETPP